jgi:predicted nucleic acid-binding protein
MTVTPLVYVLDASVAIQLVVPETHSAQATQLFALLNGGQAIFHVPDLFYIECANVCWKKVSRRQATPAQAALALVDLIALPLQRVPAFDLAADALTLALAHTITAYDACYVALAQRVAVPLITADQRLEQKLAPAGFNVIWLGNWTPPPGPTP